MFIDNYMEIWIVAFLFEFSIHKLNGQEFPIKTENGNDFII